MLEQGAHYIVHGWEVFGCGVQFWGGGLLDVPWYRPHWDSSQYGVSISLIHSLICYFRCDMNKAAWKFGKLKTKSHSGV